MVNEDDAAARVRSVENAPRTNAPAPDHLTPQSLDVSAVRVVLKLLEDCQYSINVLLGGSSESLSCGGGDADVPGHRRDCLA